MLHSTCWMARKVLAALDATGGNLLRRESLRWELLSGLDRPVRRLRHVLLAGLPGSQSENPGHRLSECLWLLAPMLPRHPRLHSWRVAPASRRAVSACR